MIRAPRSKGCRTCVQRRIKCDQTRPTCLRCRKGNRQCPGYEPDIKFQDEGPKLRSLYSQEEETLTEAHLSARASSPSSSSDTSQENPTPFAYLARGALPTLTSSKTPTPPGRRGSATLTGSFEINALVAFMSPTAYQCQLLSMFMSTISTAHQPALAPTFPHYTNWLAEVAVHAGTSSVLDWAIRTVSLSHLGRQVQDPNLIHISRQIYRKALLKLNSALQDPTEGLSAETLSATMLLSCFELLNCTERDSWIRHAGGAGHIMRLRGPERHRTGHGSAIFLAYRNSLVIEAFLSRQPCFLDTPPWRALSEELNRTSPMFQGPLLEAAGDMFMETVTIPRYHADCIHAATAEFQETALRALVSRGQTHRTHLRDLKARVDGALKATNQERTEQPSLTGDVLFPVVYHYSDIFVASVHCGYWSVIQVVNMSLVHLESRLADPHHYHSYAANVSPAGYGTGIASAPAALPPALNTRNATDVRNRRNTYIAETVANAREACRSAEFLTTSAFLGPLYLIFALRAALHVLKGEEKEWVLQKMDSIGNHLGIAKAIADIHRNPDAPSLLGER